MTEKLTYEQLEKKIQELEQFEYKFIGTEEALQESEGRYRAVVEDLPGLICSFLPGGEITFVNKAYCEYFGKTFEELVGTNFLSLIPELEQKAVMDNISALTVASPTQSHEHKVIAPNGDMCWQRWTNRALFDDQGKIVGYQSIGEDITDRKRTEEALRESEERLSGFMDSASDSFYLFDSNLNFIGINQKGLEIIGKDRDKLIGKNITEIVPDIKTSGRYEKHLEVIKTGKSFEINDFIPHPIFGDLHFLLKSFKVGDGLGIIATDITERKRAEKEKEKLETQLQQAQKIEALGTLAGGIAHDFNNLLMGIQGRASLMSVEQDPCHPHLEHVNAIEEYIQSAADLTKQLLGFARGGKYEVRPTDLNELVLSSSTMFGRTRKEIRIYNKLHNPPPVVEVDRRQVGQVLLNMYINAWQAMSGGGELYLETRVVTLDDEYCKPNRTKPGRYVKASVTDTGIGMKEDVRQRVFDPFFTTKEKSRGTGLGLASAYGIIKNHGGMISVYSEINRGTTFNIYLPISKKSIYQDIAPAEKISRGSETILLVDDEEMIIGVGKAMLENLGYRVVVANGGEQAIEAINNMGDEIDLVILDLIMPGIDGGKTFDHIRKIHPGMLVILASGYAINGQANEIMRKGCNGFIQKPFNIYELSLKVRKILNDEKSCIG